MTLTEAFSGVVDPRTGPARRHDLTEIILMALCAVFGGSIEQFENLPGKLGRVVIASKKGLK